MTTDQINAAAEDSAGGLRDRPDAGSNYERSEHLAGFKSGVKWAASAANPMPSMEEVQSMLRDQFPFLSAEAISSAARMMVLKMRLLVIQKAATPQQESHV